MAENKTKANDTDSQAQDRHHLCVTCGRLKHEDLFNEGDCTCQDCYKADRYKVNYQEAPNGNGFVRAKDE